MGLIICCSLTQTHLLQQRLLRLGSSSPAQPSLGCYPASRRTVFSQFPSKDEPASVTLLLSDALVSALRILTRVKVFQLPSVHLLLRTPKTETETPRCFSCRPCVKPRPVNSLDTQQTLGLELQQSFSYYAVKTINLVSAGV